MILFFVACILSALYDEARDFALAIYMAYLAVKFIILLCCGAHIKNKKIIAVSVATLPVLLAGIIAYCVIFPTDFPYADPWVLGKTKEEIIEVYGEPEYNEDELAYPTEYGVLDMEYYVIEFDKEGRAIRVSERPYAGKGG